MVQQEEAVPRSFPGDLLRHQQTGGHLESEDEQVALADWLFGRGPPRSFHSIRSPEVLDQHDIAAKLIQLRIDEALSVRCDRRAVVTDAMRRRETGLLQTPRPEVVEKQLGGLIDAIEPGSARFHLVYVNPFGRYNPVAVADGGYQVLFQAAVHRNTAQHTGGARSQVVEIFPVGR